MNTIDLLNQIKKNLKEKKANIASDMVSGRMTDINQYQKAVGIADGLEQASETIDETLKKLNEEM